nr:hypothetical protein [Tanacetum cinerariifolium]
MVICGDCRGDSDGVASEVAEMVASAVVTPPNWVAAEYCPEALLHEYLCTIWCIAWYTISEEVCIAWYTISKEVRIAWYTISEEVCISWYTISEEVRIACCDGEVWCVRDGGDEGGGGWAVVMAGYGGGDGGDVEVFRWCVAWWGWW